MTAATVAEMFGRDAELAALDAFFEERPVSDVLLLEGAAGIGKTTVWDAALADARERGFRVLACRPAESEAKLSFSGLGDLLAPVLDEALPPLPPLQRRALEVALLLADPAGSPTAQRTIGLACLAVLRGLAVSRPVLVAVDDAHWLDRPSAEIVEFVARRVEGEQLSFLLAFRQGEDRTLANALARLPGERCDRLELGPLSVGALHGLLHSRLGLSYPRPTLARIHETSGGNPFYALELARALTRRSEQLEPGRPLPVPPSLEELVGERIGRLAPDAQEAVALAAAAAEPTLTMLSAAGASHGSVDAAVAAGILRAEGSRLRFTHPLLAAGAYELPGPEARRTLHRRLAAVTDDPEEEARHLALAADGPDEDVAEALERGAEHAVARGAPSAAAVLAELAASLTSEGEPRERRLLEAARFMVSAGDAARAAALLRALRDGVPGGPRRARVLLELGSAEGWLAGNEVEMAILLEALEHVGDDTRLAMAIHAELVLVCD